ncbi:hypothetical protein EV195_104269 [Tenacibaculum skagerrakense]|uniref:Uncharacterized protein n=1 Tax=Tenacibaculum skagerrakense TaxID=186571 RepID=A0A4V2SLY5_9FLAO|nr:hypothetical protein EV195_104269 [Tenacibaculum skagerrakense]
METTLTDFSGGLFIWQLVIILFLIFSIYLGVRLLKYINLRIKKMEKENNK